MNMNSLTSLQRKILALLEEAGEEDLSTLISSVRGRLGHSGEIEEMISALVDLVHLRLVQIATRRDVNTLRWAPISAEESVVLLDASRDKLQWSATERLWRWPKAQVRLEVLLTHEGLQTAHEALAEDGWPG
jgi:hypothetical protein